MTPRRHRPAFRTRFLRHEWRPYRRDRRPPTENCHSTHQTERSVVSQNSRRGRVSAGLADFSARACARGGNEYFSTRCCRKLSAERSRIALTALTLLLGCNSLDGSLKPFTLDLLLSKNIIVA